MKNSILSITFLIIFLFSIAALPAISKDVPTYIMAVLNNNISFNKGTYQVVVPYLSYLSEQLGYNIKLKVFDSYEKMLSEFKEGKVHLAYTSNYDYIRFKKDLDVTPLIRQVKGGSSKYNVLLVVKKDSPYNSLAQLKGKTCAYGSKDSSHGYIVPNYIIKEKFKQSFECFFGTIIKTKKEPDSVLSVIYKKSDATFTSNQILDNMTLPNPNINRELKIIDSSQTLVHGPIFCYSKNFKHKEDISKIINETVRMGETIKGKQLLLTLKLSRWEEAKDSDYDSLRKIIEKTK